MPPLSMVYIHFLLVRSIVDEEIAHLAWGPFNCQLWLIGKTGQEPIRSRKLSGMVDMTGEITALYPSWPLAWQSSKSQLFKLVWAAEMHGGLIAVPQVRK